MNIIISLLSHSFQAIIIGLIIVAVVMGLTIAAIKGYNPRARFSPAATIAAALTSLLLALQVIPTIAATKVKAAALDAKEGINDLIINKLAAVRGGVI